MTAFLKIDGCKVCHRSLPWEWVPAVPLGGKALAGTGVWRSQLAGGVCPTCLAALERERQQKQHALAVQRDLVQLLGGEKPYREFTFERYEVAPENQRAYERSVHFNPASQNLYLWGPCGVGKTQLALAIARRCFEETLCVAILYAYQLTRKVRMREPHREQEIIDGFAHAEVFVVDDFGLGNDTAYARQVFQEILDAREFQDRAGLVITSQYSLSALAQRLGDDAIPSRLAGLCQLVEITGVDHRLKRHTDHLGDHRPGAAASDV